MEYIYGVLLLHKLGQPVNEENLKKVKVKALIASLHGVDISTELANANAVAAAPATGATGHTESKKEEKKEEEKPSESAAGLSALFG